jgi:folate receptor
LLRIVAMIARLAVLLAAGAQAWDTCSRFTDIYPTGKELCEKMWGDSFMYQPDEDKAHTMWWFEAGNPNNAIAQALGKDPTPDSCNLQYFHKSEGQEPGGYSTGLYTSPSPEGPGFTECHPWKENSCCHEAVVTTPEAMNNAYGEGYLWDRCDGWVDGYKMSDACQRFFVQEACMYECSPHAGQYRRYTDAEHAAFAAFKAVEGNPGDPYGAYSADDPVYQGTFEHEGEVFQKSVFFGNGVYGPNQWQMFKMPIKASYCDAFLTACSEDYFCGSGDFWACSADYKAVRSAEALDKALEGYPAAIKDVVRNTTGITAEAAAQMAEELLAQQAAKAAAIKVEQAAKAAAIKVEQAAKKKAVDKAEDEVPTWAWVLIGALIVIVALVAGFVMYICYSEKKTGKPVFLNLEPGPKDPKGPGTATA